MRLEPLTLVVASSPVRGGVMSCWAGDVSCHYGGGNNPKQQKKIS